MDDREQQEHVKRLEKIVGQYGMPGKFVLFLCCLSPTLVVLPMVVMYLRVFSSIPSSDHGRWGQFGDFVGGLANPSIAWMTFVAVVLSYRHTVHAVRESAKAAFAAQEELSVAREQLNIARTQLENERNDQDERRQREAQSAMEERTFQLHGHWTNPGMQQSRLAALAKIKYDLVGKDSNIIYLGKYRKSRVPEEWQTYTNIQRVWEFFAELDALLEAGMLNEPVFWRLMGPSLQQWVEIDYRIELGADFNDPCFDIQDEIQWRTNHVKPFCNKFQERWAEHKVSNPNGSIVGLVDAD